MKHPKDVNVVGDGAMISPFGISKKQKKKLRQQQQKQQTSNQQKSSARTSTTQQPQHADTHVASTSPRTNDESPTPENQQHAIPNAGVSVNDSDGHHRALLKKLRQIEQIKVAVRAGTQLKKGQQLKLAREQQLRAELASCKTMSKSAITSTGIATPNEKKQAVKTIAAATSNTTTTNIAATPAPAPTPSTTISKVSSSKRKKSTLPASVANQSLNAPPKKRKRMRGPGAAAAKWIEKTVAAKGPIAASMLGRLYQQEHGGVTFKQASGTSLAKWLVNPPIDLEISKLKGLELLVGSSLSTTGLAVLAQKPCRIRERIVSLETSMSITGRCAVFSPGDRVLAIGEGDFSWSASVVQTGAHITATSLDSAMDVRDSYGERATEALQLLASSENAIVIHGVNAMHSLINQLPPANQRQRYDFVVFNFPHTGNDEGLDASIQSNQVLIQRFVNASALLLRPDGEIHIALVRRYPYTCWKVGAEMGAHADPPLDYCGTVPFNTLDYPGYKHVTTSMQGRDSRYELEDAETHVFRFKLR
eukprot:m.129671 g.129671  ORF g.129671 m.129671 type:complete len:534 (-) comp29415_c0_seq1:82-1683(-)